MAVLGPYGSAGGIQTINQNFAESEVHGYTRKSIFREGGKRKLSRSQEGQGLNIQETCLAAGLPLVATNILHEDKNHGGDEWWAGGGTSGIDGDVVRGLRTRPVFTNLVRLIVSGVCKVLVVWDVDRLARDVAIMQQLMVLMNRHGCILYDRNGYVDIQSANGRNRVLQNMAAAQYQRERAAEDAPREVMNVRSEGGLVTPGSRIGYRSCGPNTGEVRAVIEEIEIVRRIFRLYVIGDGHGPLSVPQITEGLNVDGVRWLADFPKYNQKRAKTGVFKISHSTVYNILADCCYVGRQRHKGDEYPCPVFLVDGKPAVEEWLYEAAQERRDINRMTHSKHKSAPLSGRIVCGVCGLGLRKSHSTDEHRSGIERRRVPAWRSIGSRTGFAHKCNHWLPALWVERTTEYLRVHLGPELGGELHRLATSAGNEQTANRRAAAARELQEANRKLEDELPRYALSVSPDLLSKIERQLRDEIATLRARIRQMDEQLTDSETLRSGLLDLKDAPEAVIRETLDRVIHWAAVVPREPDDPADFGGRLVVCTRWGTLHTATIYREPKQRSARVHNSWRVRPASVDESIGSVSELPDPDTFAANLRRIFILANRPFDDELVLPGFDNKEEVPIIELD